MAAAVTGKLKFATPDAMAEFFSMGKLKFATPDAIAEFFFNGQTEVCDSCPSFRDTE